MSGIYMKRAIPTIYNGVAYDSKLEASLAEILDENNIPFKPHVRYEVFDREGKKFHYTPDFVLEKDYKFKGINKTISVLEVKGMLSDRDMLRMDALEYCHQLRGFIVTQSLIYYWKREGMFNS